MMVQHYFDDVRLDAEITHAGRDLSANVVQSPFRDISAQSIIELALGLAPSREASVRSVAE